MKYVQWMVLVILVSGCSSLTSRVGDNSQLGKPYAGADFALENAAECNLGVLLGFPPLLLISLPVSAFDIVTSTVVDTILLPVDLIVDHDSWRGKYSPCNAGKGWYY